MRLFLWRILKIEAYPEKNCSSTESVFHGAGDDAIIRESSEKAVVKKISGFDRKNYIVKGVFRCAVKKDICAVVSGEIVIIHRHSRNY